MPKFLVRGSYTSEGLRGLIKDKASGRRAVVEKGLTELGGKLESFYYVLGDDDVVVIAELPDNVSAAALSIAVSAAGLVRLNTTLLLSVEEIDQAIGKTVVYRPPGR